MTLFVPINEHKKKEKAEKKEKEINNMINKNMCV